MRQLPGDEQSEKAIRHAGVCIGYFGSYARGHWNPESNLDVVVIVGSTIGGPGALREDHRRSDRTVLFIGGLKLFKGLLLLAVAFGSLHVLHRGVAETIAPIIADLHIDPNDRHFARALASIWALDDRALKRIGAGAFFYAALLSTEGIGLLLRQRWAEYFTVIVTGSFIPLELYELARRATVTRLLVVAINVAIVWYLGAHIASTRSR